MTTTTRLPAKEDLARALARAPIDLLDILDGLDLSSLVKESVLLVLLVGTMVMLTNHIPY